MKKLKTIYDVFVFLENENRFELIFTFEAYAEDDHEVTATLNTYCYTKVNINDQPHKLHIVGNQNQLQDGRVIGLILEQEKDCTEYEYLDIAEWTTKYDCEGDWDYYNNLLNVKKSESLPVYFRASKSRKPPQSV